MAVDRALMQLRQERDRLFTEMQRLDQAIALLGGTGKAPKERKRKQMSPEAIQRMRDAKTKWWAEKKAAEGKPAEEAPKPKRAARKTAKA